jgi:PTS system fructose-specific IIA component
MAPALTQIHPMLTPDVVEVHVEETDKFDVIGRMVDLLNGENESIHDIDQVREAVFSREKRMSTGVGKGLGLPHAKSPAVEKTLAAFATTKTPIDFDAIDGQPVQIIFLLVGPESAKSQHIKLLSRISRLMNRQELRESLLKANTPAEIIEVFRENETKFTR